MHLEEDEDDVLSKSGISFTLIKCLHLQSVHPHWNNHCRIAYFSISDPIYTIPPEQNVKALGMVNADVCHSALKNVPEDFYRFRCSVLSWHWFIA